MANLDGPDNSKKTINSVTGEVIPDPDAVHDLSQHGFGEVAREGLGAKLAGESGKKPLGGFDLASETFPTEAISRPEEQKRLLEERSQSVKKLDKQFHDMLIDASERAGRLIDADNDPDLEELGVKTLERGQHLLGRLAIEEKKLHIQAPDLIADAREVAELSKPIEKKLGPRIT